MELFNGRPENTTERLPREVRTYDFLDNLGIDYLRTDHEPANNMEACNEIDPCVYTSSLKMKTADVIEKFLPATGHEYQTVYLVGED